MAKEYTNTIEQRNTIFKQLQAGMMILDLMKIESLPFILCVFDLKTLKFHQMSNSCIQILGWTPKQMESKHFGEFIYEDIHVEEALTEIERIEKENSTVHDFKNIYRHADGIHGVHMTWYSGANNSGFNFCFSVPGKKFKIKE